MNRLCTPFLSGLFGSLCAASRERDAGAEAGPHPRCRRSPNEAAPEEALTFPLDAGNFS